VKLPRDASGSDVIKALRRLGFQDRHVMVPAHGTVALGTLRNILRQAGIDLEAFLINLR